MYRDCLAVKLYFKVMYATHTHTSHNNTIITHFFIWKLLRPRHLRRNTLNFNKLSRIFSTPSNIPIVDLSTAKLIQYILYVLKTHHVIGLIWVYIIFGWIQFSDDIVVYVSINWTTYQARADAAHTSRPFKFRNQMLVRTEGTKFDLWPDN